MEGDRTWPVWAFLLGSGLRIGELVALRWRNVDFDQYVVRVGDFVSTLGRAIVTSFGRSRDAVRTIDLDGELVKALLRQRKLQATEQLAASSWEESDYAFTKPGGGPYHPQYLSRVLGSFSAELGLPRLTAHGLRDTSATLMLASGVPPKVAAERLGHPDPTLFTNLYSHVTQTMHREAASKIGAPYSVKIYPTDRPDDPSAFPSRRSWRCQAPASPPGRGAERPSTRRCSPLRLCRGSLTTCAVRCARELSRSRESLRPTGTWRARPAWI